MWNTDKQKYFNILYTYQVNKTFLILNTKTVFYYYININLKRKVYAMNDFVCNVIYIHCTVLNEIQQKKYFNILCLYHKKLTFFFYKYKTNVFEEQNKYR